MSHDDVHPDEMPDELDAFLDDLRNAATAAPAPVVGDALATLFREGTSAVAPTPTPVRRRRLGVRAVVAGAVAGIAFGGLGVAGALPRPVQQRVADVVDHVGVHLPDARPATTTTSTTSTSTTTTTARPVPSTVPSTRPADDHGSDTGHGDDKGESGEGHGKAEDSHGRSDVAPGRTTVPTTDESGTGSDEPITDRGSSGKGRSGRIPTASEGVHVDDGSHSGHDDGGSE